MPHRNTLINTVHNNSEESLRSIRICFPSNKMLFKYNNSCSNLFRMIINNRIENDHLTILRNRLLPLLMNGQVVVEGEV